MKNLRKQMGKILLAGVFVFGGALLAFYGSEINLSVKEVQASHDAPPSGVDCTIHLRHDAAGSRQQPLKGRITKMNSQWIAIYDGSQVIWIPRRNILSVSISR